MTDPPQVGAPSADIGAAYRALREHLDTIGGPGVRIVAVAKGFPWAAVRSVIEAGCQLIGENYAQEVVSKYAPVAESERPSIHFIGRLQSNKVAMLSPFIDTWQSVDRLKLLEDIARHSPGARVMIQVNTTRETDKAGCAPAEVSHLVRRARDLDLDVIGLMTMGPTHGDEQMVRESFTLAAHLRGELGLGELSMGMSGDMDIAVELGATMVRVGTAIFGRRPPKN